MVVREVRPFFGDQIHLSLAAGLSTTSLISWLGTSRVIRGMPNAPASIGQGSTGLFAADGASDGEIEIVDEIVRSTGSTVWLDREKLIDAVNAVSGSGPAYVFYLLEAMQRGGVLLGLDADVAKQLAIETFSGASALAAQSDEDVSVLQARVTSRGGTTQAAIEALEEGRADEILIGAMNAAFHRAKQLAAEFGTDD